MQILPIRQLHLSQRFCFVARKEAIYKGPTLREGKQAAEKINSQLIESQRRNDGMLDGEDRVRELKRDINVLCLRLDKPVRYPGQEADSADTP
jgi:hypothetical protein